MTSIQKLPKDTTMPVRTLLALSTATIAAALLSACASPTTQTADDLPRPQSGQWEVSSTDQAGQNVKFRDCLDRDTFYRTRALLQAKRDVQQCTTNTVRNSPNSWEYTSNCQVGSTEQRVESHRKITGDFVNTFKVKSDTKQQMPDGSVVTTTRDITGHYLGACPSGMKAGDRVFEDGNRINFYDMTGISSK